MEGPGDETFGAVLKFFRERRQLKQRALAYKIDKKNRGSIDAWERCLYRPKARETVLVLAKALQLSERETNQLLTAADFPPEFLVPESKEGRDLDSLKVRYLAWLQDQYEYMDMGGISPRVASRAGARTIKIRTADIFIPLHVKSGSRLIPHIAHIVPVSMGGDLDPENFMVNASAADLGIDAIASTADGRQVYMQAKSGGFSKENLVANQETGEIDFPLASGKAVSSSGLGMKSAVEVFKQWWVSYKEDRLPLTKLLECRRVVVLGHPGAGKTTLGKYLAYALATGNTTVIGNGLKGWIPLLVRAADYGKALKRDESLSFYRYVTEAYYTDHFGPLLAWALEHHRCLVIIDGLDEIPDPVVRAQATRKIDQFVSEYRENCFLVSSRIVGYRENQLSGNFVHVEVAEWSEQEIVAYLEKWYQAITEKPSSTIEAASKKQAQHLWKTIKRREGVRQLAGIPLLLMIMALVDQYGSKLPERRVEVYQLATETLLSHWPFHHREQQIDFREMLDILEPIAYHIFTANEDRLITEYEFRPLFEEQVRRVWETTPSQTRIRSMKLLRTIEEHTGFLLKRGTNEHGQELYGFLHPTFAEYLTARYFARCWEKERVLEIADRIHEPTWHEVVLLMAGHLGTLMPIQATRFLDYIEKLPDPVEDKLHRNLLLVAEIIGDGVPVERYKRDEVISQLITLAQETVFEPLWESIIARLKRMARAAPLARMPDLLKQREKDTAAMRVRKVLLARALGFQRETDLGGLLQGLLCDEMTRELVRTSLGREFDRRVRKSRVWTHTCYIGYTTDRESRLIGEVELSKQEAERLHSLPLPIRDDVETMGIAPPTTPIEIWLIGCEQLLQLGAQRLAKLYTSCRGWKRSLLYREIDRAPNFRVLLREWITQATTATADEERISALNVLSWLFSRKGPLTMVEQWPEGDELPPTWRTVLQTMASSDKDPQARALAFWIAPGLARDQEARDDLIMKGLSDRNPKVRGLAVEQAMGRVGSLHPQDHIASLILGKLWELTTDPSLEVRVACAQALCNLGLGSPTREDTARLIDLFCALLVEDLTPRDASMEIANLMRLAEVTNDSNTIETIGNRLAALIAQMAKVAGVRAEQLSGHMGPAVAKQEELARLLSPLLPHPEPGVRRLVAAIWAAYLKDLPDALPIIPFLQDNDAGVRCAAIEALGNNDLVKPTVLNVLLHALRNDTPRVKLAILRRIGGTSTRALTPARSSLLPPGLDQPKVVDDLLYVLGDVAPQIAIEAASLLTSVQDPALREKIIETVNARAPENPAALSVLWNLLAPPVGA